MHSGNWGDFAALSKPAPYAKAIVGALITGLGSLYQAADGGVTLQEGIAVAIATLTALAVVWGVPNADPKGEHQDESVQPPERGNSDVLVIVLVVLLLMLLLGVFR